MARTRTTKKLAQRVDLNYFKRPTAFKRAKLWLSVVAPLLAIMWIAWHGLRHDSRVYSSGRMSGAHAVLERQCAVCHVQKAGQFSSKTEDGACLACHDGPIHQENQVAAAVPSCATCHREHRGRIQLSAASDDSCAECHGNLKAASGQRRVSAHIRSLSDGHPEFRNVSADHTASFPTVELKFSHATHMKSIRRGPNGPMTQMDCEDCHRSWANGAVSFVYDARYREPLTNWPYAEI